MSNSVSGGDDSDDVDDSSALEALGRKFANDLDCDGLVTYKIPAPTLEEQLAYKTKVEIEENVDQKYERSLVVDCEAQERLKAGTDVIINTLRDSFKITKRETSNVPLAKPGRDTIIPRLSGSLFSAGTKIGIKRLLDEKKYRTDFETIMRDQLMQNFEEGNLNSFISNCDVFESEEGHCIAKYLLFAMSICKAEIVVDKIYNSLLDFLNYWNLQLKDFLDIFVNWGIPEELLNPPYIFNKDTCSTNVSPDCNIEVGDYNISKVLEYTCKVFNGNVRSDLESTMTIVRAVLLMWLDKRFATSWSCPKFGSLVKQLVEGIDTDVRSLENVVCRVLDLSHEHMHDHAWLVAKLLESKSASACLVGRLVATQFLLRAFDCAPALHPSGLDLRRLHTLLVAESDALSRSDLYFVHVVLLVVDAYVFSYPVDLADRETFDDLVRWVRSMIFSYSDDAMCELLDRQIIVSQMKIMETKLKCCLEDYFDGDEQRTIYWNQQCIGTSDPTSEDLSAISGVSNQVSEEDSNVVCMDGVSDEVSEKQSTVVRMDVVSEEVSEEQATVVRMVGGSEQLSEEQSTVVGMDVVSDRVSGS